MRIALLGFIAASLHAGPPAITAIVSAGSFTTGKVAAGAFATIFGSGLSDQAYTAQFPWPTTVGMTTVMACYNPAPGSETCVSPELLYVDPHQINLLMPALPTSCSGECFGLGEKVYVLVSAPTQQQSNTLSYTLWFDAPDIFFVGYDCVVSAPCSLSDTETTQATIWRGTVTDEKGNLVYSGNPARVGPYYTIWLTGISNSPQLAGAGPPVPVLFSVENFPQYTGGGFYPSAATVQITPSFLGPAPGFIALSQINFQIPATITNPVGDNPWPCGNYAWEVSLVLIQGVESPTFTAIAPTPVLIMPGDVPCK
jgi:uncharacterized protein (TIGR03437 family)